MEIDKAIQLLSDSCDRGLVTYNADYRDAVRFGRYALIMLKRLEPELAGTAEELERVCQNVLASMLRPPAPELLCCAKPECGGYVRSTTCINCGLSCRECRVHRPAPGGE